MSRANGRAAEGRARRGRDRCHDRGLRDRQGRVDLLGRLPRLQHDRESDLAGRPGELFPLQPRRNAVPFGVGEGRLGLDLYDVASQSVSSRHTSPSGTAAADTWPSRSATSGPPSWTSWPGRPGYGCGSGGTGGRRSRSPTRPGSTCPCGRRFRAVMCSSARRAAMVQWVGMRSFRSASASLCRSGRQRGRMPLRQRGVLPSRRRERPTPISPAAEAAPSQAQAAAIGGGRRW